MSELFDVRLFEISFQSELRPHGTAMAFIRDLMYQWLDRDWKRYRGLAPIFFPRHIVSFMRYALKTKRYVSGGGWLRSSAIEMMVTDKHIRAWSSFLETDGDYLICFEDDAVFKDDSIQRLADLLGKLRQELPRGLVYVDLAGGCQLEALGIDKLETCWDGNFRHYSKPVTNTACTYLMSRSLVVNFHDELVRKPWLRLIGVDWMMNKLFMLMEEAGSQCDCLHANPAIFKHGTFTGEYVSWQASKQH